MYRRQKTRYRRTRYWNDTTKRNEREGARQQEIKHKMRIECVWIENDIMNVNSGLTTVSLNSEHNGFIARMNPKEK